VQQFITSYGYLAIFVLMLAESACIPVPSELIMTFGGAVAAGAVPGTHLSLIGVILAGTAGNVAGSYLAWAVGRYGGQPLLRRLSEGRLGRHLLREHDLDRAIAWFDRHGGKAVLIGRLLPVVRTFISLPAGIAEMPALRFGIYTTIGCIPWTAALAMAGYAVGTNWESIANAFHGPSYIIAAVVLVVMVLAVWRYARRRQTEARAEVPAEVRAEARPAKHAREGTGPVFHDRALGFLVRGRLWRLSRDDYFGDRRPWSPHVPHRHQSSLRTLPAMG
jgi:membrane protein DedA with SNARE-associated domain